MEFRAQRATKADAKAYAEHIAEKTDAKDTPAVLAELKFAEMMAKMAIAGLTPTALKQVRKGNMTNKIGAKFVVAAGRASLDLSDEPAYQKAAERLARAKAHLTKTTERLAAAGKGKAKVGSPSLRVTIS
jgi:hypothetical protein